MPKEQLVLNQFEGGLMEYHDPRDIPENALSKADDVMVDKVGKIRLLGKAEPHKYLGNPSGASVNSRKVPADISPGYGFHTFGADHRINMNSGSTLATMSVSTNTVTVTSADHGLSDDDIINFESSSHNGQYAVERYGPNQFKFSQTSAAFGTNERAYWSRVTTNHPKGQMYAIQNDEKISILDRWACHNRIDLGTNTANVLPSFYNIDNALRVCDSNFDHTNNNAKWYGYIPERTQFYTGLTDASASTYWDNNGYGDTFTATDVDTVVLREGSGEASASTLADIFLYDGLTMKITFDLTLNDSKTILPLVYLTASLNEMPNNAKSEVRLASAGSNTIYLTPRSLSGNTDPTGTVSFYTNGDCDYNISSFAINYVSYIPSGWYEENHELSAPALGNVSVEDDDIDLSNNLATTISQWKLGITKDNSVANGQFMGADTPKFRLGMSYVYLGNQESKVYEIPTDLTLDTNNCGLNLAILSPFYSDSIDESTYIDHRIIGVRVYITKMGSTTSTYEAFDSPLLLADVDNVKGARWWNGDYVAWGEAGSGATLMQADVVLEDLEEFPVITYKALNGYDHDQESISAKFKTAATHNRRVYIGNVLQDGIQYGDRILKSPIGKYDIFSNESIIDVVPGDGDEIVKLIVFANKLMVFKSSVLYMVNISEDYEFIESTHKHLGVKQPSAVTETPLGPVWVNSSGCHYYNGEQIINLIDNKINSKNWREFLYNEIGMVGYIPYMKQLVVINNPYASSAYADDVYVYDFITQSWTKGYNKLPSGTIRSNIISSDQSDFLFLYQMPGSDETTIINDTTSHTEGTMAFGSISWSGGTLAADSYLHFYKDGAWARVSSKISTTTLTDDAQIASAIQDAVNGYSSAYHAEGSVNALGTGGIVTFLATASGTDKNTTTQTVDGNTVFAALSTVQGFDDNPDGEGSAPFCGLTNANFGTDPVSGGSATTNQATTVKYNRNGSTEDGVKHKITILFYPRGESQLIEGYVNTSYTTSGGSDDDTAVAAGIDAALDAADFSNGMFIASDELHISNSSGQLNLTAKAKNRKFEVFTNVVGATNTGVIAVFNNLPDNAYSTGRLDLQTRDSDFGSPGVRKKVYKVYVTFKNGSNVKPQYAVNGVDTWYDFTTTDLGVATDWTQAELKPATSSQSNNIFSIKVRLVAGSTADGSLVENFEVNDISVIYRVKSIK